MAFNSRGTVITGKLHIRLQERTADAGTSMAAVDGETRNPPHAGVLVGQHPRESSVTADTGESIPRPNPAPPDWLVVDVSDEPGRHGSVIDLLPQGASVVRRLGGPEL
jgi:hypothetical protein